MAISALVRLRIDDAFKAMIGKAERRLADAELEHEVAMATPVDEHDPEDVAFVALHRAETEDDVYVARRIADALVEAADIALRGEPLVPGVQPLPPDEGDADAAKLVQEERRPNDPDFAHGWEPLR